MDDMDFTRKFSIRFDQDQEIKAILTAVYDALKQKGYDPINQIVGYILSEDPTYITNYNNARTLIRKLDRDELLQELVRQYLSNFFFKGRGVLNTHAASFVYGFLSFGIYFPGGEKNVFCIPRYSGKVRLHAPSSARGCSETGRKAGDHG